MDSDPDPAPSRVLASPAQRSPRKKVSSAGHAATRGGEGRASREGGTQAARSLADLRGIRRWILILVDRCSSPAIAREGGSARGSGKLGLDRRSWPFPPCQAAPRQESGPACRLLGSAASPPTQTGSTLDCRCFANTEGGCKSARFLTPPRPGCCLRAAARRVSRFSGFLPPSLPPPKPSPRERQRRQLYVIKCASLRCVLPPWEWFCNHTIELPFLSGLLMLITGFSL